LDERIATGADGAMEEKEVEAQIQGVSVNEIKVE